jgi:hypothetical protein
MLHCRQAKHTRLGVPLEALHLLRALHLFKTRWQSQGEASSTGPKKGPAQQPSLYLQTKRRRLQRARHDRATPRSIPSKQFAAHVSNLVGQGSICLACVL